MQDENIVRDLHVSDGGRTIRASYFVERGMIHASIDGRTLLFPAGPDETEETVRRLVIGQMRIGTWRERMLDRWRRW